MANPNKLDAILDALRLGPASPSELRRPGLANSRKAAITSIYRLRNLGHDIITVPPGSRKGEASFKLVALADDLRRL